MTRTVSLAALLVALSLPASGRADPPNVVADIAPVHSLVAQVMKGIGEPELLVAASASPHGHALRPSQARAVVQADVVFWIGEELTPWLGDILKRMPETGVSVPLLDHARTITLPAREEALFEEDGHGEHEEHEEHHHHDGHDPHAWLDTANAATWLGIVSEILTEADPENGALYARNAEAGRAEIARLETAIRDTLTPVAAKPFVVHHDAYQYFEARFGLRPAGAIARNDAATPGPKRLKSVRDAVAAGGVGCVFSEAQASDVLPDAVIRGTATKVAMLDPLGRDLPPGPDLYAGMMTGMADAIAGCLK